MAANPLQFIDTLLINDSNNADIQPSDILNQTPFLSQISTVEASNGNIHKYLKYTTAPTVGFRQLNLGRELQSSADTQVTINLAIMDASFACDVIAAKTSKKGIEGFLQREAIRHLQAAMFKIEQTVFSGVTGTVDAAAGAPSGFNGLDVDYGLKSKPGTVAGMYNDLTVASDVSTTYTSVYLLRMAPDGVALVLGNGMSITIDPTIEQAMTSVVMATAGNTTTVLPVYYTPICAEVGLQIGGLYDACRIINISTAATGARLDDDAIYTALSKFPAGGQPNIIVMNRVALEQLRTSRTATNVTGAPAPRPTEVDGIPVVLSDAIANDIAWIDSTVA